MTKFDSIKFRPKSIKHYKKGTSHGYKPNLQQSSNGYATK